MNQSVADNGNRNLGRTYRTVLLAVAEYLKSGNKQVVIVANSNQKRDILAKAAHIAGPFFKPGIFDFKTVATLPESVCGLPRGSVWLDHCAGDLLWDRGRDSVEAVRGVLRQGVI